MKFSKIISSAHPSTATEPHAEKVRVVGQSMKEPKYLKVIKQKGT